MPLAPIALFVYNRPDHTLQTLQALARNRLSEQSKLYIFADGLKKTANESQTEAWKKVQKLIHQEKCCGEVEIVESLENKGLAKSITEGVGKLLDKYGKVIVLEDDLLTSIGFLEYMNKALDLYENSERVFALSGYTYPADFEQLSEETFFLPWVCSWAWATWADKWKVYEKNIDVLLQKFDNQALIDRFNFRYYYSYEILQAQAAGKTNSWAIHFYASVFFANGLSLFPKKSLVQNIGFDGSGVHSTDTNYYAKSKMTDFIEVKPIEISENLIARKALEKSFQCEYRPNFWQKVQRKIQKTYAKNRIG